MPSPRTSGTTVPVFSYVEPTFTIESIWNILGNDYHPPSSLYEGESFLKRIYDILISNPAVFRKTLFIVTFDEHGGTFDHVPPPANAIDPVNPRPPFVFNRYGVRVPTLLISPCVPAGSVFRAGYYPGCPSPAPFPYDHASVLATLLKWRSIPYQNPGDKGFLGTRTAQAPTFDNVIGAPANANRPSVTPFACSDIDAAHPPRPKFPHFALPVLIARITGHPPNTTEHAALVASVRAQPDDTQKAQRLMEIRDEYGM